MKKLFILLLVLATIAGGGWFVLTTFVIDAKNLSERLVIALEQATGRKVLISQTTEVTVYPLPQVTFNGLTIGNIEGAVAPNFISASKVTMKLDFSSLLAGSAIPSGIIMDGATMDAEVLKDGRKSWQFKGQSGEFRKYFENSPVTFNKAAIRYANATTDAHMQVDGINGVLRYEEKGDIVSFTGDALLHGQPSQVIARMNSVDLASGHAPQVPFQLALKHAGATITAQGKLSGADSDPEFIGQVKIDSPNLWDAVGIYSGNQAKTAEEGAETIGFNAEGNLRLNGRQIVLEAMQVSAKSPTVPAFEGTLNAEYGFGTSPVMQIKSDFSTINLDFLTDSYKKSRKIDATPVEGAEGDDAEIAWLKRLSGEVDVSVAGMVYNGSTLNDVLLSVLLSPEKIIVQQGRAKMPGETVTVFSGETKNQAEGITFDGKLDMQGGNLAELLALVAPKGTEMPPLELGRFAMRTNMSLAQEQFRFSEFQAIIADSRMAGSMILHRGNRPALESYLRVAGINLDTLADAARYVLPKNEGVKKNTNGESGEALFDEQYLNTRFDWLNTIGMDVNSDFYLQDFVLFERKGKAAKFNLKLAKGEATIDQLQARYNSADIAGKYGMRTEEGKNPLILIDGTMSELNMIDVFPDLARTYNDKEWQDYIRKPMELLLLQTYRADVKLRVGKFTLRNYKFENVDSEILLENSILNVDKLDFNLWDGAANARLRIQAGTIPTMSSSFRVQNADLLHLSEATSLLKHAAGRTALNGHLSTSGVSLFSWYNNMQGEIRVQARDISMQGFGIANLARAVPVARTVNDVERAAEIATHGGVTRMNTLDGIINVTEGKAGIPQMSFTSTEAAGTVEGSVDLVEEALDLKMHFYLLNTVEEGENPPMLTLHLTGDVDDVQKDLEARDLKNYVAQSAARRTLGKTQ